MENMTAAGIKQWLEIHNQLAPRSSNALYYRIGHAFSQEPMVAAERDELGGLLANIHSYRVGECYMNAGRIAVSHPGKLTFCEGLAAGPWPMEHAWVSYKGRAIDVTWPITWEAGRGRDAARFPPSQKAEAIMRRVIHNLRECSYYGVEVPFALLNQHFLRHKRYSPLFDPEFHKHWLDSENKILKHREKLCQKQAV